MRGAPGNWVGAELALARRKRAQTATEDPPHSPPGDPRAASPLDPRQSAGVSEAGAGPRLPRPPRDESTPCIKKSAAERSPHSPARRRANAELHRVHHAWNDLQKPGPRV
ncbi:N-myc proto-oncogene protein isoform X3 [Loxodonta africana]|uniref:N-myc proto-oncogene protein isoform X3 n=1 Tax=Loxodonta africana TaxID=9785 RepID=UPI000C813869|nr:N-myc proto-oncogene protein isoform X1 [Loxodonta africana]XP_049759311.1 N-myc proto-oncogene protein isoform X3 [Elephas maximus indicus]